MWESVLIASLFGSVGLVLSIAGYFLFDLLEWRIDFAQEIATWYPLRVIMSILGVPREDLPLMHKLTKTLAAPQDSAFGAEPGEGTDLFTSIPLFTEYFLGMIADRRRNPRDDLASVIANGTVHGGPMGELETVSYFITMAVAGHDTTAASIAGGMRALAERPAQWNLLQRNPDLLRSAADEMIRWVTPIRHFMRTAATDCAIGGPRRSTSSPPPRATRPSTMCGL